MRKVTYTAFIAFWASALTLIIVHQLQPASADDAEVAEEASSYTLQQLAAHDSEQDCWMAIDGKVYALTEYLPLHPTPPVVLIPWCGKDATEGMRTKGYGRDHSAAAWTELERYLLGTLAED